MFYLQGETECVRTLALLASREGGVARTASELYDAYIDFVVDIGGDELRPSAYREKFCFDASRIERLIGKHQKEAAPNDLPVTFKETPVSAGKEVLANVQVAMDRLAGVNPGLYRLFDLVIHTVFYHRSQNSGGGSISSAPGVIWCSPKRTWSQFDLAEFLVHELTHNILFLDERRYEHYSDPEALFARENFPVSAVLGIPRPLDRAFHSLVVATEVLCFRAQNGEPDAPVVHPTSPVLLESCFRTAGSIRDVLARGNIVTPRFLAVMDLVEKRLLDLRAAAADDSNPAAHAYPSSREAHGHPLVAGHAMEAISPALSAEPLPG